MQLCVVAPVPTRGRPDPFTTWGGSIVPYRGSLGGPWPWCLTRNNLREWEFHSGRSFACLASQPSTAVVSLQRAVQSLEHPGLAARLTNMVGKPIELIGYALPTAASDAIATATSKALDLALKVALGTIQSVPHPASRRFHKALATASGAAGGAFGLISLPIELPVSTIIMLRSIAEIARSEGEDLSAPETALACVQVFALGGRPGSADASE